MTSSQPLSDDSPANIDLENNAREHDDQATGSANAEPAAIQNTGGTGFHCSPVPGPSTPNNPNHKVMLPQPFVSIVDQESFEVINPYGSANGITLTEEDMGRRIPVWNCILKYKLAGSSAPLGRNLLAYLKKKNGEFEVYTDQDKDSTEESARITLWNKDDLRKISGSAAPLRKNAEKYLKEHPYCELYNGQDEKLDTSVRRREHNRVTLWNKVTCRKTSSGCSRPLRKNLQRYLSRHPQLEEYTGQDKLLAATRAERDVLMGNQGSGELSGEGKSDYIDQQGCTRQHPKRCGKRPIPCSNEIDPSQGNIDHNLIRSPKRHDTAVRCDIDLSGLPDMDEFAYQPIGGPIDPLEWYESFYGITQVVENSGLDNPFVVSEDEDDLKSSKIVEEGLDRPASNTGEDFASPTARDAIQPQGQFLDLDMDPVAIPTSSSPDPDPDFNPDDFFIQDS